MTEYNLIISGTIGAGKSTNLEKIVEYSQIEILVFPCLSAIQNKESRKALNFQIFINFVGSL